jgi:hypothetical protein
LSCPSVGVANDKGQQSGGYTPPKLLCVSSTFHIKEKEERRETSVRGRKMTGYDSLELCLVFSRTACVSGGFLLAKPRINYLFFLVFFFSFLNNATQLTTLRPTHSASFVTSVFFSRKTSFPLVYYFLYIFIMYSCYHSLPTESQRVSSVTQQSTGSRERTNKTQQKGENSCTIW